MSLIAGNLAVVQRALESASIDWGVYGGAAAHLYGNRRPINNVDIVTATGTLQQITQLLQASGSRAVQFDGSRLLWRGIYIYDDLTLRGGNRTFPFTLDAQMLERRRRMPLLGSKVMMLGPEDVIAHKVILASTPDHGRHDLEDILNIAKRQKLDIEYLRERLQRSGATDEHREALKAQGVEL